MFLLSFPRRRAMLGQSGYSRAMLPNVREIERRLRSIPRGADFVCDQLACYQCLHACGLDGSDMNEDIGTAAVGRDEAISAICIEEFDPPSCHFYCALTRSDST